MLLILRAGGKQETEGQRCLGRRDEEEKGGAGGTGAGEQGTGGRAGSGRHVSRRLDAADFAAARVFCPAAAADDFYRLKVSATFQSYRFQNILTFLNNCSQ